jgi:hypothetical protein
MPTIHLIDPKKSTTPAEIKSFPSGTRLADIVATFVTEKTK